MKASLNVKKKKKKFRPSPIDLGAQVVNRHNGPRLGREKAVLGLKRDGVLVGLSPGRPRCSHPPSAKFPGKGWAYGTSG